jgi:hypothetical protein
VNGWDLLTWIAAAVLAVSAVTIFALFVKDARKIYRQKESGRGDRE